MIITCAVCGRPVDKLEIHRDDMFMVMRLKATCHGQVEWCTIEDQLVANLENTEEQFSRGVAFSQRLIDEAPHQ